MSDESEKIDSDRLNRLWQHGLHEDQIFNERLNFFFVFESVLLGVIASLYNSAAPKMIVLRAIMVLALAVTVVWGYVQAKQKYVLDKMKERIRELDSDYQETILARDQKKWPFSITWLLAYPIPAFVAFLWVALLIILR